MKLLRQIKTDSTAKSSSRIEEAGGYSWLIYIPFKIERYLERITDIIVKCGAHAEDAYAVCDGTGFSYASLNGLAISDGKAHVKS